ncbi:membrane protein [Flavobacterium sp. 316]|uniref:alpha-2-macroglobulin family protein n=1 Tax=Flavobacterium sp. 316 TaxID=1603293 RepID=UPI0005EA487E|nr:MG2 domain-containing protein [Flavobacterium sp. 316]KIX21749.1 membrane protein [Flavobacterium sp. 316]
MKSSRFLRLFLILVMIVSCSKENKKFNSDYSLFKEHILNFSSGLVSAKSDVRVVLAFDNADWTPKKELDDDFFTITPSVEGKVIALSTNTLAFVPNKPLESNKEYQISLHLSEIKDVPKELKDFNFSIKTIKQDFIVSTLDLQSYSKEYLYLNGIIATSDNLDLETANKLVKVEQNGKQLKVKIDKELSTEKEFKIVIDSIQRFEEDSKITIKWNGKDVGIDQAGTLEYEIPGKNNFKIISAEVQEDNNQVLLLNFSDPLKKGQNFDGLIDVESASNLKFSTAGNLLKIIFSEPLKGELLVEVFQGIQSEDGFKMKQNFSQKVSFEQIKPAIKFIKSGTILPSSNNLKINFEAVNLSAVDVKIYKIHKNNILQFLQDNQINGSQNLRKVASPIAKQKIVLKKNSLINYSKWGAYALDLSKIIEPEPGAIYRVEINFKKKYSLYKCSASQEEEIIEEDEDNFDKDEVRSNNDYYYDDYYYDDYDWYEREDPCTKSYYYRNTISTNVIATDLGVIAKRGENGSYLFAVNDIISTNPVSGATIELYDFQQQKLASVSTDAEGIATIDVKKYAYFAIVTKDKNTTYVRLDEGQSLSVSNFEVSGETLQKGLKGYIYGERGVWRPGDTLHIAFMLNDNESKLEKSHPIKFKLSDPRGKLMYQSVQKYNENNHYKFKIVTKDSDITGNWEAKVSVGGASFFKSIKIETIKPNRLKIKNSFADAQISGNNLNKGEIEVNWLHGAVAKNLKVEMQAKFMEQQTTFKGYSNYDFDDDVRKFYTEEVNVFSGKVDESGKTDVTLKPEITNQAPGKLKIVMQTKAFENGGDFSTDVVTASFSPYKTYVGLKSPEPNKYGMLETGKVNRFDVVTLSENGRPKAVRNLEVRVYKVEWRWWWNSDGDDLARYNSDNATTAYKNFNITTNSSGKGSFQFSVPEDDWGRYLIRVVDPNDGHATSITSIIDWPYWSGKTKSGDGSTANMLVFASDKEKYAVGEKAIISFPSSAGGRALLSLENGSKVVKTFWANTSKGETKVEIPVTPEMAPNVYVNITLLKPHGSTLNDTPIRMYGIIPIEVIDKNTVLEPQVSMPQVLRPEQKATLKVSEKSGKEMTYTVAIVDEGLLDLTRFKTPNAWDKFYSKQALGVKTWDVYDDVIGAYGGKINQIFSIGGDEDLGGSNAKKANRFKPVVIYLGPYKLEKGQTKSHTITLPNYVGSVRTMIVAGDAKTNAYGSAEKTTPVRNPLMVLASVPRKISPNEKITLPVTVFAMENNIKNVTVQVKTNNGIRILESAKQQISFSSPDEKMLYFNLEVGDVTGIGKIEVIATSGSEKASFPVEIDIVNPNPETTDFVDIVLEPNTTKSVNWETFGITGTNKAQLEISSFPTIDFNRRLKFLIQYPHGCVEQTTSSVFPQLYLTDVVAIDDAKKQDIQRNVNDGIQRLGRFQISNGGLPYWQGSAYSDDWGTSYAGHFMIEAEKKGYVLPVGFKQKWISYQQRQSKQWRYNGGYYNDFAQAYRLYTLALAGSADLASMNRLRETVGISDESKLRLAATYAIVGQKNAALKLINEVSSFDFNTKRNYYYYGSEDRSRAMLLETYLLVDNKTKAFELANRLAKSLSSNQYMSTQTTAYSLYAMSKFAVKNGGKGVNTVVSFNGKSDNLVTQKSIIDKSLSVKQGKYSVSIKNNNSNTIYVRVLNSGVLPIGQEKEMQKNLSAVISYKAKSGAAINFNAIYQGTEIIAQVTIRNNSSERIENVALTQIIPSGFEIMNSRYTDFGSVAENKADYIDIRDDRTNFYFSLKSNESRTFTIALNASYLGDYYLPGIQCEAMYDDSYVVRNKGQWIKIIKE